LGEELIDGYRYIVVGWIGEDEGEDGVIFNDDKFEAGEVSNFHGNQVIQNVRECPLIGRCVCAL
jgi:hypothetical protein